MKNKKVTDSSESSLFHIGKDTLLYLPGKIIPVLCTIAGIFFFTRLLTAKEYGGYILIISAVGLLSTIVFNWLGSSAFRFFEEHKISDSLNKYISTIYFTFISVSILLFLIAFIGYEQLENIGLGSFRNILYWMVFGLLCTEAMVEIFLNILRADRKVVLFSTITIIHAVLRLGLAIAAIGFMSLKVDGILGSYLLISIMICIYMFFRIAGEHRVSPRHFSTPLVKSFADYGFPVAGTCLCMWALSVADRFIIQLLKGPELVGIYASGYQVAGNLILLPSSLLMMGAYTVIIQVYEQKREGAVELLLERLAGIFIIFGTAIVLFVGIFSGPITKIFLGQEFQAAANIMIFIAFGQFCLSLSGYVEISFQLTKKTAKMIILVFIAAALNIILNFMLIPVFEIKGAALATFFSYFLYFVLLKKVGGKQLPWPFPWKTTVRCLGASVMCFVLYVYFIPLDVYAGSYVMTMIMAFSMFVTYFFSLMLMGEKQVIKMVVHTLNAIRQ